MQLTKRKSKNFFIIFLMTILLTSCFSTDPIDIKTLYGTSVNMVNVNEPCSRSQLFCDKRANDRILTYCMNRELEDDDFETIRGVRPIKLSLIIYFVNGTQYKQSSYLREKYVTSNSKKCYQVLFEGSLHPSKLYSKEVDEKFQVDQIIKVNVKLDIREWNKKDGGWGDFKYKHKDLFQVEYSFN